MSDMRCYNSGCGTHRYVLSRIRFRRDLQDLVETITELMTCLCTRADEAQKAVANRRSRFSLSNAFSSGSDQNSAEMAEQFLTARPWEVLYK